VQSRIRSLRTFVAESAKSARQFLKAIDYPHPLNQTPIEELNEHTPRQRIAHLLQPVRDGCDLGLLSDAGCPAVADPGSALVALAHAEALRVVPLVGPSSLLLALMASGLEGQRFCFHGYLPVERAARADSIRKLEHDSRTQRCAQLVIETPYRNNRLLEAMTQVCQPDTRLCVAADLTLDTEFIRTLRIAQWRGQPPDLDKRPAVFVLQANLS
jgi:16S rRNA (cytidine1402-2'-O)-methyltransferase